MNRYETRVVLADDHTMVREALARVLEESGTVEVVAQASDGVETLAAVVAHSVEVAVIDYSMPDIDAVQLVGQLRRAKPELKVLVLTMHENIHYAVRTLESGAHGYVIKSAAVEELVDAIDSVREGKMYVSPRIAPQVLEHLRLPRRERIGLDALTPREFDLLRNLAAGSSLQECAVWMQVTTSTASTYRARVLQKLNLRTTADLIRFALENGIAD